MNVKEFTEKAEQKSISKNVSGFLSKHRIVLISIPAALILIAGIYGIFLFINKNITTKDFDRLDTILYKLEKDTEGKTEDELQAVYLSTKEELHSFVEKKQKGAASARAFMALAGLEFEAEQFQEAKDAYNHAAKANPKSYTASIAYYNAAVCAEELGELSDAISFFEKATNSKDFALVPQALFNMGRIALDMQDAENARVYFQKLVDTYSTDPWSNLAKSQLLALDIRENR